MKPTSAITVTGTAELSALDLEQVEARAPRRYALVFYCGERAELVELRQDAAVVVGREFPSQVQLDDAKISRQHARFVLSHGKVSVEDLGSRNGTLCNGSPVLRTELVPGDVVLLGATTVALAATRSAADPAFVPVAGSAADGPIVQNAKMRALYALAARVAPADAPVLILGETGTGKEHLAHALHAQSPRKDAPFVPINCGAIPQGLAESVLFGHERGAFTGAERQRKGIFEQADGGVVFLDEVGELSLEVQAKLLRALESKRIARVGSASEIDVDVRVIAATHCDLPRMIEDGTFRPDLYYRLNAIALDVPPLRERHDELEPLARMFLREARAQWGVKAESIAPAVFERMQQYDWPGNVRQLRNVIERAALLAHGELIDVPELPEFLRGAEPAAPEPSAAHETPDPQAGLREQVRDFEARVIDDALRRTGNNKRAAARVLRLPLRTLFRRIRELGLGGDESE